MKKKKRRERERDRERRRKKYMAMMCKLDPATLIKKELLWEKMNATYFHTS